MRKDNHGRKSDSGGSYVIGNLNESAKRGNSRGVSTRQKRTEVQREADLALVSKLLLRENLTQQEIADKINAQRNYSITNIQIAYDIKELTRRWREAYIDDIDTLKGRELQRIDQLESAYWDSYERSLKGNSQYTQDVTEYTGQEQDKLGYADGSVVEDEGSDKKRIKKFTSRKFTDTRDGEVKFLNGVQYCIDKRCEILGLNAPLKSEMTFDWRTEAQKQGFDPGIMFNEMVKKFVDGNEVVDGETRLLGGGE